MNDDTNSYYTILLLHKFTNAPNVVNDVSPPKKEKFSFNLAKKNIVRGDESSKVNFPKKFCGKFQIDNNKCFILKVYHLKEKLQIRSKMHISSTNSLSVGLT